MKQARTSTSAPYNCKRDWPEDCFVQAGHKGIVFSKQGNYTTAFFEAFPKSPDTFIRGEGSSIEEAETSAWNQYVVVSGCKGHEFERRGYRNGGGFCIHCGMFSGNAFEPLERCVICDKPNFDYRDKNGKWYCKEHKHLIPQEDKTEIMIRMEEMEKEMEEWDKAHGLQ